jgi:electron transfer flavoprotein alpha subunit
MSVLVYAEISNNEIKKASLEAAVYASKLAKEIGEDCHAVAIAPEVPEGLEKCGVSKIHHISDSSSFDAGKHAGIISDIAQKEGAKTIVISNTYAGKSIAPRAAVKQNASLCSGVVGMPVSISPMMVKKSVYSGKAFAEVELKNDHKILALTPNSIDMEVLESSAEIVSESSESVGMKGYAVTDTQVQSGSIPLTEAELVVSGGRGLKGPENWNLVEDLADTLKAATACSKPVSDMEWRPHSEHVGQTGITIKPNLYIAIGISGAIQHLAGVSSSKVIVVINKDPEAPFFKAADYGIVGDAFDVVPKLTAAVKELL